MPTRRWPRPLPASWTITKIAALGCNNTATCTANRKFMFAPDVVVEPAPNSGTHILLVGSGDREKPLRDYTSAYGVSNYFFMLKDVPSDSTWLSTNMGTCPSVNVMCLDSLYGITSSADPAASDLANKKGWYLGLNAHEQVVTSSITVFGSTTFSSHTPTVPDPDAWCLGPWHCEGLQHPLQQCGAQQAERDQPV